MAGGPLSVTGLKLVACSLPFPQLAAYNLQLFLTFFLEVDLIVFSSIRIRSPFYKIGAAVDVDVEVAVQLENAPVNAGLLFYRIRGDVEAGGDVVVVAFHVAGAELAEGLDHFILLEYFFLEFLYIKGFPAFKIIE